MENISQSELRGIISVTGPDAEEEIVFLGFFVNLLRQFGINDPSHPEILKFGLLILKKRTLFLPKFELPIVFPQWSDLYGNSGLEIVWVGIFDNRQLFCHEVTEGLALTPVIKIEKKMNRPGSIIVQRNITPLYASYLERYLSAGSK